jgi:aryl-alcohol dehydrogenase-like predicted oxidoreductase
MYGAGLSEIRLSKYLAQHDRDDYVLSTKVGRLILDEIDTDERNSEMFKFGLVDRVVYDYSETGALKSIEGSLNRLGVDRLDFVFVPGPARQPPLGDSCALQSLDGRRATHARRDTLVYLAKTSACRRGLSK